MNTARNAYVGSMVQTASPARLLVLLYDRLVVDLQRAAEAQEAGDHQAAGPLLMHAQDIVLELQSSLRVDAWDGAAQLSSIYTWLHGELVRCNVRRDPAGTHACHTLALSLADAWGAAALAAVEG
ncbi:MAG: flagellar export chaperone FliS [Nocardioidaceae bacterium]